ncbi:PQQ-binding-like beta-propeller repeat protein [Planctomycetaceae bacterium SH139]
MLYRFAKNPTKDSGCLRERRERFASRMPLFLHIFAAISLIACFAGDILGQDWPQWRGIDRNATIDDPSLMKSLPVGEIPKKWTVAVGPGYSGPTIADGLVYLTDRSPDDVRATERILCFRATDGKLVWQHEYPVQYKIGYEASGPRASVTIEGGRAFAVGGMGMFHCLEADSGKVLWARDLNDQYKIDMPNWGITTAPLVYRNRVIQVAGGPGACLVALDVKTGNEIWRALDDRAGYSAPILVRQGETDVVVCWTGESVSGINPTDGDVFWSIPMLPRNMPIGVPTPVIQGTKLFVSSFYDGSLLIDLAANQPKATTDWRRIGIDERNTDALHAMISNPIIKGDHIYGADSYGEFRCLELSTGDRVWEDLSLVPKARWATVHIIRNGEDEIILNDQGELLLTRLSPQGPQIRSRSQLIKPTRRQLNRRNGVVWSHPAIADGVIYARNDEVLIAASLRAAEE